MQIGIWETAQRLLREYGDMAERECDARAVHYAMQGDKAVADGWRRVQETIGRIRLSGGAPDPAPKS